MHMYTNYMWEPQFIPSWAAYAGRTCERCKDRVLFLEVHIFFVSRRFGLKYVEIFLQAARDEEQYVLADSVKRAKDAFDKAGKKGKDQLSLEAHTCLYDQSA